MSLNFGTGALAYRVQSIINQANRHIPYEQQLSLETNYQSGQVVILANAVTCNNPRLPYSVEEFFAGRYKFDPAYLFSYPQIQSVPIGVALTGITLYIKEDGSLAFAGDISVKAAEDVFEGATFENEGYKQYPVLVFEDPARDGAYDFFVLNPVTISDWGGLSEPTYISSWWIFDGETATQAGSEFMDGMAKIGYASFTSPLDDPDAIELFRAVFTKVPYKTYYAAGIYQLQKYSSSPENVNWNLVQAIGASGVEGRIDRIEEELNALWNGIEQP